MNNKQKRFAVEYLIDLNATQAAIRAGYSPRTAGAIGAENLKKPEIQSYLSEQLERICTEKTTEAREILEYLTSVMRGEIKNQTLRLNGCGVQAIDSIEPSARERLRAAELLGKYYGLFKDGIKLEAAVPVIIKDDLGHAD